MNADERRGVNDAVATVKICSKLAAKLSTSTSEHLAHVLALLLLVALLELLLRRERRLGVLDEACAARRRPPGYNRTSCCSRRTADSSACRSARRWSVSAPARRRLRAQQLHFPLHASRLSALITNSSAIADAGTSATPSEAAKPRREIDGMWPTGCLGVLNASAATSGVSRLADISASRSLDLAIGDADRDAERQRRAERDGLCTSERRHRLRGRTHGHGHAVVRQPPRPRHLSTLPPAAAQAAADHLRATLQRNSLADIPSALIDKRGPGTPTPAPPGATVKAGNLQLDVRADGSLAFSAVDSGKAYFAATPAFAPSVVNVSYLLASLDVAAGDATERIFGLGQGNWTQEGGCRAAAARRAARAQRPDGQPPAAQVPCVNPVGVLTAGYGLLFNMPGYGNVSVGRAGGMAWQAHAALWLDFWVTGLPAGATHAAAAIYEQYADATATRRRCGRRRSRSGRVATGRSRARSRSRGRPLREARSARRRPRHRLQEPGARRRLCAEPRVLPVGEPSPTAARSSTRPSSHSGPRCSGSRRVRRARRRRAV